MLSQGCSAKLPNFEGIRADICELLKESNYINNNIESDRVSYIVSRALDRLHYMDDPCVKYDLDRKMWIYLHKDKMEV